MSSVLERRTSLPHRFHFEGTVLRTLDLTGVNLSYANLKRADARDAILVRANFADADMAGMDLRGADLTGARNLTVEQLLGAIFDESTRLPAYIDRARLSVRVGISEPSII
ncbi:pentapeptide repeat-containing protein [Aureimonas sp. SA4125]|uniref:pentapeptide repeat-containing protein n=1 Tax=Aureimonas sp. SA4125 TaxID=2826993 RepID=UPI001CC3DA79|nr:pentapeptide repeat-containing protein [Aureimonas sp. SA4125]